MAWEFLFCCEIAVREYIWWTFISDTDSVDKHVSVCNKTEKILEY